MKSSDFSSARLLLLQTPSSEREEREIFCLNKAPSGCRFQPEGSRHYELPRERLQPLAIQLIEFGPGDAPVPYSLGPYGLGRPVETSGERGRRVFSVMVGGWRWYIHLWRLNSEN